MTNDGTAVRYYPIYLSVEGERCVIAGGGAGLEPIAEELLRCGARLVVIAPAISGRLRTWAEAGELEWQARAATAADAEGAFLTLAATGDAARDAELAAAAERAGRLGTPWVDQRLGNFLAPPSFRQGDLTVAISTSGRLPALESRLIDSLRGEFGPEWATFLPWLGEKRSEVKARHPSILCRIRLWDDVVATDVLPLLRQGRVEEARARYEAALRDWQPDDSIPVEPNCCRCRASSERAEAVG